MTETPNSNTEQSENNPTDVPIGAEKPISPPAKIAVIDVGSNSIHLMIVQVWEDFNYTIVHEDRTQIRLGSSVFFSGIIDEASQQRAVATLKKFLLSCRLQETDVILPRATSAIREAQNSKEVIARIKAEVGLDVVVISGREEARLTSLAATQSLGMNTEKAFVLDVGGGTTEVAWVEAGRPTNLMSLQLGPLRILEKVRLSDPPGVGGLEDLRKFIRKALIPIIREKTDKPERAIGTSGTALCLGDLCGTRDRAPSALEIQIVFRASLQNTLERLSEMTLEKRRDWLGAYGDRADSIIPGGMIFLTAMEELDLQTMITGAKSLREGIILDYIQKDLSSSPKDRSENLKKLTIGSGYIDPVKDIRAPNIVKLARRYGYDPKHSHKVMELSRMLFEELRSCHWLGEEDCFYLESAALLHDIGYHISTTRHHLHSHYLVENSEIEGFHQMELKFLANLVRYHSHEMPSEEHAGYQELPPGMRRKVDVLAGLLRIADGLDFTHQSLVSRLSGCVHKSHIQLDVFAREPIDLEIEEALMKSNLIAKALEKDIVIHTHIE